MASITLKRDAILKNNFDKKRFFCILFWSQPKEYDRVRGGFPESDKQQTLV